MPFSEDLLLECWFLCGPTACGKTALALELAPRAGFEIVALDSMTLYRGMDIGTAKPTPVEQRRAPHHLLDLLEPHEEYSLAQYLVAAESACHAILARGRKPLFVGGTGLYLRGVLRGVFDGPGADWDLRRELETRLQERGHAALHEELGRVDPQAAARLHPHDARRVIRALEVYRLTGRPLSEQQQQQARPAGHRPRHVYWLSPPRDWLAARINDRVEFMARSGLLQEVRRLSSREPPISHTARQALGYKEVLDALALQPDMQTLPPSLITDIQTRTRQFAKRQLTWFRNLEECVPIPLAGDESLDVLAGRVLQTARDRDQRGA